MTMHPTIWTIPGLDIGIPSYGVTLSAAALIAIILARRIGRKAGYDTGVITNGALIGLIGGLIGSRVMFVFHHRGDMVREGKIGVAEAAFLGGGAEVLGGVILGVLGIILYVKIKRKPLLQYFDLGAAPLVLAMGLGRIGCLLFGCCWGDVCQHDDGSKALPWAVRFPYGSPAYVRHWEENRLQCPVELEWVPPDYEHTRRMHAKAAAEAGVDRSESDTDAAFEPIPREVLYNEKVCRCADALNQSFFLREKDPNDPRINPLLDEAQQLMPALKRKRLDVFAKQAAIHLKEISTHTRSERPFAMADLQAIAATQRSAWVHPSQLYSVVTLSIIALILYLVFRRRNRAGMVVATLLILYPINRFIMETLRGDNPHDVAGFTVSQFISIAMLAFGIIMILVLRARPIPVAPEPQPVTDGPSAAAPQPEPETADSSA
jgi:prolipoprotein diacylglyceryltransferase